MKTLGLIKGAIIMTNVMIMDGVMSHGYHNLCLKVTKIQKKVKIIICLDLFYWWSWVK